MSSMGKDLKSLTVAAHALAFTSLTAAGTGDNTEVDGVSLDTTAAAYKGANSVLFVVNAVAALTAEKTLIVTANLQDSADNTNWTDITTPAAILTLAATGSGVGTLGYDLSRARRYVRIQATPDLSHSGTDTATITGVALFGGLASR